MNDSIQSLDAASENLARLLAAVEVESDAGFRLGGRRFSLQDPGLPSAASGVAPFVDRLTWVLYRYVYSHAWSGTLDDEPEQGETPQQAAERRRARLTPDEDLLGRLSAANPTSERWEHGWTIAQILPSGQIQAQRGHLQRLVWPGQFLSKDGPGAQHRVGAQISLFYSKESVALQPGFYYMFGETPEEQSHAYGIMRLYWNVEPSGAPPLLGVVGRTLNRYQVPFRMKCAVALPEYERTDVAVLYLPKSMTRFVFSLLPDLYDQVRDHVGDEVPFFSRKLAPGLSLAEDPGTGESFGQHRCRLVAEAVWNCFLHKDERPETRLAELRRLFADNRVHPDHCHMNADSREWYELPEVIDERAA